MGKYFTEVYLTNVSCLDVEKCIPLLPKFRVEKVYNLAREKDQRLSAGVYLLLCKAMKKHGINVRKYKWRFDKNGKPYINCPIHFSMSHSGDSVAVVLSNKPVGIDIEKMDEANFDVRKYIFTEKEEKEFQNCKNKVKYFYEKWTKKEAQFKQDGRPFKNDNEDPIIYFYSSDYVTAVTTRKITNIEIIVI